MKDFKKMLKLTWKRYAIWIILLAFFFTLLNTLGTKNNFKWEQKSLIDPVIEMERDLGKESKYLSDGKLDKDFFEKSEKLAKEYAKKYNLKEEEEKTFEESYNLEPIEEKNDLWDKYSIYNNYLRSMEYFKSGKYLVIEKLTSSMAISLVFIIIASIGLTSIEESLNYYDFTRMLPWSKKKEFLMKVGISLIFGIALFAINTAVVYFLVKTSVFSEILSLNGFGTFLLKSILAFVSAGLIGVSLGLLSGNFLGHIGLSIIAIGFIEWFKLIVFSFASVFGNGLASKLNDGFYKFKDTLNPSSKVFLSLMNANFDDISTLYSGLVVAIVIASCAYFLIGKSSAERSGYMVKNKVLSEICKWSGILSLTSILFMVVTGLIGFDGLNIVIRILAYGLSLLISYKLFDILFKIRLKF